MAWPLGDLVSVVREVYEREGSIRAASRQLGVAIGTVQDILANPDRERRLSTLGAIQDFYERARPLESSGPFGTVQYSSPYWLDSQIDDIRPPRGADAFLINYQSESASEGANGWRNSGWRSFSGEDLRAFLDRRDIASRDVGSIRFGRRTGA